jgi:hypothetical protein
VRKPQVPDLAALNPYHDGNLAAILVMSFTVVSGLVAPRPNNPKLREQRRRLSPPTGPRRPP